MFLACRTFFTSNLLRKCSLNYLTKAMEGNDIHLGNLALLKKCTEPYACSKKGETESSSKCNTLKNICIKSPSPEHNKIFVQTFSPTLGKLEWEVQNEDYDYIQEVARSAYADMLHDDERNELYYAGLREAVHILRSKGQHVRVLDIGTGTGLLSMLAVSCGADVVTACEAFEPMAECAEKILAANNMADKVHVIHKRSTDLCVGPGLDMAERANLLVAEVFDTELIGEGAISTYAHAKECLLTPDALLVPSASRVYAQVVCSPALHAFSRPYANIPIHLPVPQLRLPAYYNECPGSISVHDVQMSQLGLDSFIPLSDPMVVFKFDWSGRTIPLRRNETTHFQFQPAVTAVSGKNSRSNGYEKLDEKMTYEKRSMSCEQYAQNQLEQVMPCSQMTCHAVLMWWDLVMDQTGDIILTCAPYWEQQRLRSSSSSNSSFAATGPNTVPWRDHWMQAVYHLPPPLVSVNPRARPSSLSLLHAASPKEEPQSQSADDVVLTLTAARDEYSMWFAVTESHKSSLSPPSPSAPHCSCGTHMTTPRSRLAQLSDTRRVTVYSRAVNDTLDRQHGGAARAWLVLGDSVNLLIIGQLASDHRVSHVFVHEPRQQGRRALRVFMADNNLESKITLLPEKLATLTKDMLKQEIGVVFAEPYFNTSLLPWHNLCVNTLLASCNHLLPSSHASADETSEKGHELALQQQLHSLKHSNWSTTDDLTVVLSTTTNQEIATDQEDMTNQEVTCISHESDKECNSSTRDGRSHSTMSQTVSRPLTSALVLPGSASLYVMPVSFLHLWKIRAPCEQRCGFDLGIFDELIDRARSETDDYVEPQPLWEYPCYALHSPILLKTLDLTTSLMTSEFEEKGSVDLDFGVLVESAEFQNLRQNSFGNRGTQKGGTSTNFLPPCAVIQDGNTKCNSGTVAETALQSMPPLSEVFYNGVTLWVDWNFGHAGSVTTGPVDEVRVGKKVWWDATTQQGVHLPRRSVPLQRDGRNTFHYSVHWKRGQMTFSFGVTTGER